MIHTFGRPVVPEEKIRNYARNRSRSEEKSRTFSVYRNFGFALMGKNEAGLCWYTSSSTENEGFAGLQGVRDAEHALGRGNLRDDRPQPVSGPYRKRIIEVIRAEHRNCPTNAVQHGKKPSSHHRHCPRWCSSGI
jgi:hypothetical protein